MCYPFMCDSHPFGEVSQPQVRCAKHHVMHDPRVICPECLKLMHGFIPDHENFESSMHIENEAVLSSS